jgi:hypothetical protein
MKSNSTSAKLYLNNRHVGDVTVRGWEGAWGMGEFSPNEKFMEFEPLYRRWSELMHAGNDPLDEETSAELRRIENEHYRIAVRMFLDAAQQWRDIAILNIDGTLIEWKER